MFNNIKGGHIMDNLLKKHKAFIKRDPLYSTMLNHFHHYKDFELAGFIDENRNSIDELAINDLHLKTIHLNPLKTNKPIAIVVSSGSFSPLHEGHIETVLYTKQLLEEKGYEVPQSVLCFAHDNYVSFKNNGAAKSSISERIQNALVKLDELDLSREIKVEHLSGQFVSNDLNFSTLLNRIEKYAELYYQRTVKVFYVFGSDYPNFFNAFKYQQRFGAVCFEREEHPISTDLDFIDRQNFFYVSKDETQFNHYSSTKVRNGINKSPSSIQENSVYLIREDGAPEQFADELKTLVEKYLDEKINVKTFSTKEECFCFDNTISLDKFVSANINLDFSRLFPISSLQKYSEQLVSLSDPNFEQLKQIKAGNYVLIDDDIVSGFTIKQVSNLLKKQEIFITKKIALVNNYIDKKEILYDIIDARDFFINGKHSGLVTSFLDHQPIRTGYFYPFVNMTTRAKIPADQQIFFTIDVLNLNKKYHDLDEDHERLLRYLENHQNTLLR